MDQNNDINPSEERAKAPLAFLVGELHFNEKDASLLIERAEKILGRLNPNNSFYATASLGPLLALGRINKEFLNNMRVELDNNGEKLAKMDDSFKSGNHSDEYAKQYFDNSDGHKKFILDSMDFADVFSKILVLKQFQKDINQETDDLKKSIKLLPGDVILGRSRYETLPQIQIPFIFDALSLMDAYQVQDVLSAQEPHLFNTLLEAYKAKNRDGFEIELARFGRELKPMPKIYDYLVDIFSKNDSYNEYIPLSVFTPMSWTITKELVARSTGRSEFVSDFETYLEILQHKNPLEEANKMHNALEFEIASVELVIGWHKHTNKSILGLHKIKVKYDQLRREIPELSEFENIKPVENLIWDDIDQALTYNVVLTILNKIHQEKTTISTTSDAEKIVPIDYREYFVSTAPKIDYQTMRDIAVRLSGKVKKDKGLVDSGVAYLRPQDVTRFCYFFLHEISAPDNIADVDFSKPIKWLANWQSQKYFIYKLYGKPKPFPSGMAEEVVACFRFKRVRKTQGLDPGQVRLSTYKNSKDPLVIVSDDDKKRIDNILKEFGL